uniref:Uncharacterized protein n=1 Tax=Arundo donax TaxID=35708 RepID=A0A0A9C5I8_ARUDO
MFYNYIVSVFVQEMIRLISYFSCIMLDCKCSARKLWFDKSFVVPELLV